MQNEDNHKIITEIAATPFLFKRDGTVVIQKRSMYDQEYEDRRPIRYPGYYCLPGGKMEDGETPEEALIRETQEEMDITLFGFRRYFEEDYPPVFNQPVRGIFFTCEYKESMGEIRCLEGDAMTFMTLAQLLDHLENEKQDGQEPMFPFHLEAIIRGFIAILPLLDEEARKDTISAIFSREKEFPGILKKY